MASFARELARSVVVFVIAVVVALLLRRYPRAGLVVLAVFAAAVRDELREGRGSVSDSKLSGVLGPAAGCDRPQG